MRSSRKIKPVDYFFLRRSYDAKLQINNLRLWRKGTRVFPALLEKNLSVYNGNKFIDLAMRGEILGSFLGSLVLTKRITAAIHSKTRKNKKGRRKKKKA